MENSDIFETDDAVKSQVQPPFPNELKSEELGYEQKVVCRLCAAAVVSSSRNFDSGKHGWIKISDKWFHSTETIDFVMKKYLPAGLMTTRLSNEIWIQHICETCFISLQQLKDFFDLIRKGQEKLLELYFQQHSNEKPKKRGRPKKDVNNASKSATKQTAVINVEEREKRTSRPPRRYGSEPAVPENLSNVSAETAKDSEEQNLNGTIDMGDTTFQLLHNEIVPLPGVYAEVIVEDTLESQSFLVMQDEGNNEIISAAGSDQLLTTQIVNEDHDDDDTDTVKGNENNFSDDKSDANFTLSTFRRKAFGKKIKRGRPKKGSVRVYKCDLCEKVFMAYASLVYHQLSNHQENAQNLSCTLCDKQFTHKALLANHMFTHSSIKAFTCEEGNCKSSFKSRASLYNHVKAVHWTNGMKMFTCEICGNQFTYKTALQVHLRLHTGEKPFKCKFCNKSFSHSGNMKEHVRTHTKEKPYVCNISECGKKFATSSQLKCHKMRHLVKKPFMCAECGKSFSKPTGLAIHMKSHKEKSQKCSMCPKEFNDSSALRRHQRMHSGEKPYKCGVCKKSFSDPSNFRKHKKIHPQPTKETVNNDFQRTERKQENPPNPILPTTLTYPPTDVIISKQTPTASGSSSIAKPSTTGVFQETNTGPETEPYIQIMTPEELTALSIDPSSSDGNIIILYQPDKLFSGHPTNEEIHSLETPVQVGETVVLEEVEEMAGMGSIHDISFETNSKVESTTQGSTKLE